MDFMFLNDQSEGAEIMPRSCGSNSPCNGCKGCKGCSGSCKGCSGSIFVG